MPIRPTRVRALSVFRHILGPQKIAQAIFKLSIASTPTKARIRFSTIFDGVAFVTLYKNG
jgi:hypothetical protein